MIKRFFITILTYIILPFVVWWVRHNEKIALRLGRPLSAEESQWAESLGIIHSEKIRILNVARMPSPLPHWIERFFQKQGYPVGNAAGMCMRYGIYVVEKYADRKSLLAHELVHTHQFERLGGHCAFLHSYLYQCMLHGYSNSQLESEADDKAREVLA